MKIAVYTITKNESQFIARWAESCKEADYRVIIDTGSTDDTIEEAKRNGCDVASISVNPWRFDDARNASLSLLPLDADFCISLDADEILMPGWREALEQVPLSVTRPRYKYVWSWNADGSEGLTYSGDKIHARKNYRWVHPVHEVLACTATEIQSFCHGLEIHHHPDATKSRSQYLPLLELAVRERPDDDRNQFYLGREYMFNNQKENAERHLLKHLELSAWDAERATAMRYLSRVTPKREHWLLRACAEAPHRREPWVELARFYYEQKAWVLCLGACERALAIKEKPLEYLCEADAWGSTPHDLAVIASWNVGLKELAIRHSEEAIKLEPSNSRLTENHKLMLSLMGRSSDFPTSVDVVIPTKSNLDGLKDIAKKLDADPVVSDVYVVADGIEAMQKIVSSISSQKVKLSWVPLGSGIHEMWNVALRNVPQNRHLLFLNDDVVINDRTVSSLSRDLDSMPELGLVCANYDQREIQGSVVPVLTTCRGRYDKTGGLAGFCMMLRNDLTSKWRFDTRMKWWYGDDDLLNWVVRIQSKTAGISSTATCKGNESWTIANDPPINFAEDVERDRKLFELKWGSSAR